MRLFYGFVYRPYREWREEAACLDFNTDDFFTPGHVPVEIQAACNTCPVRVNCVLHAVAYNEKGYWGGLSRKERERLFPGPLRAYIREFYSSKETFIGNFFKNLKTNLESLVE